MPRYETWNALETITSLKRDSGTAVTIGDRAQFHSA